MLAAISARRVSSVRRGGGGPVNSTATGSSGALGGPTDLSGKGGGGKLTKPVLDISEMETGDLGMTS